MSIVLQEKEGNPVEIHIINQFNEIWKSKLLLLIFSILIVGEGWYWLWVDVLHVLPCVIPHQSMSLLPSLHLCQCDIWFLTHKLKICTGHMGRSKLSVTHSKYMAAGVGLSALKSLPSQSPSNLTHCLSTVNFSPQLLQCVLYEC